MAGYCYVAQNKIGILVIFLLTFVSLASYFCHCLCVLLQEEELLDEFNEALAVQSNDKLLDAAEHYRALQKRMDQLAEVSHYIDPTANDPLEMLSFASSLYFNW